MNFLSHAKKKGLESLKRGFDSVTQIMDTASKRVSDILKLTPKKDTFEPFDHPSFHRETPGFRPGVASAVIAGVMTATTTAYGVEMEKRQENIFRSAVPEMGVKNGSTNFGAIPVKRLSEGDIERPLQIGALKSTNILQKQMEVSIPRKTKAYTPDGLYAEPFLRGKKVILDPQKPILIAPDGKTYTYIIGHNNTGADVIQSLLIRTTWLDDKVGGKKAPKVATKKNIFEGYLGYNSRPISPEILELETRKVFAETLKQVRVGIAKVDAQISETREDIKKQVIYEKKSIKEIPSYAIQKQAITQKQSLTQVGLAIQSFVVKGAEAITMNSDVEKVLKSFMATAAWKRALHAATAAEDAKIKKRYRR